MGPLSLRMHRFADCESTNSSERPESASLPTKPRTESKPSNELSYREVSVPGITVELSAGQADAEMRAPLPWHQSLKSALQSRNGRASESLRCLSADLAAYISTHGNLPVPSTLRHLELRCGAKGVGTDILFEIAEVTEPLPGPAQLWEMWEGPLQNWLLGRREAAQKAVFWFLSLSIEPQNGCCFDSPRVSL